MQTPFFVSVSTFLHDNRPQLNYGAAVIDLDGDGAFEIYVTCFDGPSQVLKWDGAQFVNVADGVLANNGRRSIGVAACDTDADGREELYVLNTDTFAGRKRTGDSLFKSVNGLWVDLFLLPDNKWVQNLFAGRSVGCIDRLGTGRYGFFVANYGGPMRLYEMLNESVELIDAAPELGINPVTGGRGVLTAPIISERMDIFLNNEQGPNLFFRNNGDGTFAEVGAQLGIDDPFENGRGVAAFDANDDGLLDLVCGNWEGQHRLFIQQIKGIFKEACTHDMARPSKIRTVIAADFDNDGHDEIFFNNIGEPNRLFGWRDNRWTALNAGDALEPYGAGTGAVIGDFDRTGQLKLLICHGESHPQPLTCYRCPPNDNHWLRVLPLTAFGAPARGAIVRLKAGGRIQTKVVDAGSGYLCQMEPVAHFGLGGLSQVEYAEIQWPDTTRQRISNPRVDTQITVQVGCK